jgi:alginate O-acetyltransferase complex protein AlgI
VIFTELRFVLFFVVAFSVHWLLRGASARKRWLLVASYCFYGAWDWRFLFLMAGSTVLDYLCGLWLGSTDDPRWRRLALSVSLVGNLGSLALFKYYDFFVESAAALVRSIGFEASPHTLGLVLPAGISFYTFQTLSYTIDVYRRQLAVTRDFVDFAFFVSFFPQLVAGPIVRASDFLPQLERTSTWRDPAYRALLFLFLAGFVKKAVIADNLAPFVDTAFEAPSEHAGGTLWLGMLACYVQVYCDFSGYSDMAIATAGMLGYSLCLNFDFPIFARSITAFWGRWHVSLGTWFRDYLYIPLGGSRKGERRTRINLLAVFLLCGLWHGAEWTFIAFGGYVGVLLILERMGTWRTWMERSPLGLLYNWVAIGVAMVFFRSSDLASALVYLGGLTQTQLSSPADPLLWPTALTLAAFLFGHFVCYRRVLFAFVERLPGWSKDLLLGAAFALALPFAAHDYAPFIYFQF